MRYGIINSQCCSYCVLQKCFTNLYMEEEKQMFYTRHSAGHVFLKMSSIDNVEYTKCGPNNDISQI